jgi:hypothetical protein
MRRLTVVVVALFILAGGVAAAAVVDHRHKNTRMGPADVASWYCQHRGQNCQEPQAADIEEAWQHREVVYRVSFWALSLGGLTALLLTFRLRRQTIVSTQILDGKSASSTLRTTPGRLSRHSRNR